MKPPKLRAKLALFYAAVFTLLLSAVSALFYNLLAYQLDADLHSELRERAAALRGYLSFEGGHARLVYDVNDPEEAYFVGNATRFYQVYDVAAGAMIERSPQMEALGFQYTPEEVNELVRGPEFTRLDTDQVDIEFYNCLVHGTEGHPYLLQVGAPLTLRNTTLRQMLQVTLWLIPSGILLALMSGWWMAGRVLRPLEVLSATVREMSIAQLHRRLPLSGTGDELDQLAKTFNDMFGRLEKAVEQMKDFTANISHELRTPLTALRGEAEVTLARARTESDYRTVLESQLEEFAKLSKMIDQMLTLARAEAGQIKIARERVNLSSLAESLVDQMEPLASIREISLTADHAGEVSVIGDSGWLERVILNLLDNAIKFTPQGGHVTVRVSRFSGEAVLEVQDDGIGIDAEALSHIFERFYRGDPSRSKELDGAGLGLSLAEWIVQAHHGRISVDSLPRKGTMFRVSIPLAPASFSPANTPRQAQQRD